MHPLTDDQLRASLVNASEDERERLSPPTDLLLTDWDHIDFLAWGDPRTRGRGYVVAEIDGVATGIVLRAADAGARRHPALCNFCHTMQPGDQVGLFTAHRAGRAGERGDSIGTYICADLSCHENVRLAGPLAPGEFRASVDRRIDGTHERVVAFVERVIASE